LNRVSFLRPDHTFISQALKHPSTTFLLFNNLDPLVKSPDQLAYRKFADVKSIIGEDPFHQTEADTIAQYNSSLYQPQIIFLGIDEKKDGIVYKDRYKGQPWFAVDITPRESVKEEAEKLIESLKSENLDFSKGRMNMSLPAEQGPSTSLLGSDGKY
jgi:NAD+ diphosphatase